MKIVLMRHGNTFAPGQKAVMVGGGNDLPLVERGWEQADACRKALARFQVSLTAIHAGPLLRTRGYAERLRQGADVPVVLEECLRELDYGPWTGLSDEEIAARPDSGALTAWREEGVWPPTFVPGRDALLSQLRGFISRLLSRYPKTSSIAAVTSAGVLRGFLEMDPALFEQKRRERRLGFKTGHLGILDVSSQDELRLRAWDVSPEAFEV